MEKGVSSEKQPLSVNVAVGSAILGGSSHSFKTKPVTVQVLGSNQPNMPRTGTMPRNIPRKSTPTNFNVKIFNPDNKKEQQVFVLRDVSERTTTTPEALVKELHRQFGSNVPKRQTFQVGFMKGSLKISIRTPADMADVWLQVSKGTDIVLWCEGVGGNASDSEEELPKKRRKKRKKMSAIEEKNERIEETICRLREKHKDHYTPIQYRLWAEMLDIGTHRSEDDPPCIPAFNPTQKLKGSSQISQLTSALTQIAGVITPTTHSSSSSATTTTSGISPAKMASLRNNYLQQMRDLHMFLESGAISEAEFMEQKLPILQQLKKLVPE